MDTSIVTIEFNGDQLDVVREDESIHVVIKRVNENLRLDHATQLRALRSKPWARIVMKPIRDSAGRMQATACLDLDSLPMWLATIETAKVAKHIRQKLERYQIDCARWLADKLLGKRGAPSRSDVQSDTVRAFLGEGDLRDNAVFASECQRLLFAAARGEHCSFAKIHGAFRKSFGVVSYLRVRLPTYPLVREWLTARLANPTEAAPKLLERASAQLNLFSRWKAA